MKRTPLIIVVALAICVVAAISAWSHLQSTAALQEEIDSYDSRDGKNEAEADIARGTPKWKVSGRVIDAEAHAASLKRLGIELDWFADCIATEGIIRYRYDYNTAIRSHFVRLIGESTTSDVIGRPPIK